MKFALTLTTLALLGNAALACPPAASFQAGYAATTVPPFALPGTCPCQAGGVLPLQQGYAAPLTGSVGGCGSAAPLLQQGYGLNAGYGTLGVGVGTCGAGTLALNGLGAYGTGYGLSRFPFRGLGAGYGLGGGFPIARTFPPLFRPFAGAGLVGGPLRLARGLAFGVPLRFPLGLHFHR